MSHLESITYLCDHEVKSSDYTEAQIQKLATEMSTVNSEESIQAQFNLLWTAPEVQMGLEIQSWGQVGFFFTSVFRTT